MGRTARKITGDDWTPAPWLGGEMEAAHLCEFYDLPYDDDILTVLSNIRERGSRERAEGWTAHDFKSQRQNARNALALIVREAAISQSALERLGRLVANFAEEYEFEPNLMQQIAAVGPGSDWFAAEELQCFSVIMAHANPGGELNRALGESTRLKIARQLPRARIPNIPLQKCVMECRSYWKAHRRACKIDALEDELVCDDNNPAELTGDCERFVCDLLRLAGIDHTLHELRTALEKR